MPTRTDRHLSTLSTEQQPRKIRAFAVAAALVALLGFLPIVPSTGVVRAQAAPDRSEVVLVLDFSASILTDTANRNRFAAALDRIADRAQAISADLVAGDATMTIIQFAATAADYPGCTDLRLLANPAAVTQFAGCLRNVANAYRKGLDPALSSKIGIDTNYVAAMQAAARHLPADAVRPAMILFTDGKHDVAGVPASQVQPTRDQLFGQRSPFALLPVGMGLIPAERAALEQGLLNLRVIRNMPACVSGAQFNWPQVVFQTPDEAGNAVAVALQDVTCTFTVAPSPSPSESPTPSPTPPPDAVAGVSLKPGDGQIQVSWTPASSAAGDIVGYRARCRSGSEPWAQADADAKQLSAVVGGLKNGTTYACEVAVLGPAGEGPYTAAPARVIVGRPATPPQPSVGPLDGAIDLSVASADPAAGVSGYRYECSSDGGRTWPFQVDAVGASSAARMANLTNGVDYVCRAMAENDAGLSDPSQLSAVVRPCGSLIDCNPMVPPILAILVLLSLLGVLASVFALYRGRTRGYAIAIVDSVHTVNLGSGSRLGIRLVRDPAGGRITGIEADRGRHADIRVRYLGGDRFEVRDGRGRRTTTSGQSLMIVDGQGVRHELTLRHFATASAARVSGRA